MKRRILFLICGRNIYIYIVYDLWSQRTFSTIDRSKRKFVVLFDKNCKESNRFYSFNKNILSVYRFIKEKNTEFADRQC